MVSDYATADRLAALEQSDGIPPGDATHVAIALYSSLTGDGRRAVAAAVFEGDAEHLRLVGVHATRGIVHAWHGLLGQPDWRAAYDSRTRR